jgi:hypothetical protein
VEWKSIWVKEHEGVLTETGPVFVGYSLLGASELCIKELAVQEPAFIWDFSRDRYHLR